MTEQAPEVERKLPPAAGGPRRQGLSEEVASYIRELIFSGQVRQGEFLRLEPVAEALGVSNTPVREGLLTLRAEGLVRLLPRRGFLVAEFTPQDVRDLFWVQAEIAGELAARAASRITDDQLRRLADLHERHCAAVDAGEPAQVEKLGHEFHRIVNLAAGSPRLALLLDTTVQYLPTRFYATIEPRLESTLQSHPEILAALRARDATAARKRMRGHILVSGERLLEKLHGLGVFGTPSSP